MMSGDQEGSWNGGSMSTFKLVIFVFMCVDWGNRENIQSG